MAVIYRRSFLAGIRRVFHTHGVGELRAIIARYRFEDPAEIPAAKFTFQAVEHHNCACSRFI